MSEESAVQKKKEESAVKEVLSWVLTITFAVVAALFLTNYVIINANIPSGSMENTIMENDRLFGNRLAYFRKKPERGDIIIFEFVNNMTESDLEKSIEEGEKPENYIKRVIGLPGETIEIKDAKIYINGAKEPLKEDYLKEQWTMSTGPYTFEVPKDSYLVLGDNRNNSSDARFWIDPYVAEDKILGKAVFRYFPIGEAGSLY